MTLYLKALRTGRRGTHTDFTWPLDEWVHVNGDLKACVRGLHVCRPDQIMEWLNAELWLVEADDRYKTIDAGDKCVVRRARLVRQLPWDDRTARLFVADCAEHVLHLFERQRPDDNRPRLAIEAARAYARGEISAAARDAARAAARAAAGAAAGDAAWDAAWAAAWDAARDAARAAARAAAWDAAWAAAWDAARAAARAAAGDAAWDAAGDAAWDAERAWQGEQLMALLDHAEDERAQMAVTP